MATYIPLQDHEPSAHVDNEAAQEPSLPASTASLPPSKIARSKRADVTKSARTLILLAFAAVVIPICGIIIALLVVISTHRVDRATGNGIFPFNGSDQPCSAPAYLVDFSATTLVIPGTWISTIANLVAGFLMFLLSFWLARAIKGRSLHHRNQLPTPKQLSLFIGVVGGGVGPLWDWCLYTFGWRKQRVRRMSKELKIAVVALFSLLVLGLLIQLADLWFHEATTTVLWDTFEARPAGELTYGRQLSADCLNNFPNGEINPIFTPVNPLANDRIPCSVGVSDLLFYVRNASEGHMMAVGSGLVSNVTIADHNDTSMAILLPARPDPLSDWRAESIGVSTLCKNIMTDCVNSCHAAMSQNCDFNCNSSTGYSPNFSGKFGGYAGAVPWNWTIAPNEMPPETADIMYNTPNPYKHTLQAFSQGPLLESLENDPRMVQANLFATFSLLQCSTAVHNVTYRSVNGTIAIENAILSNTDISQNVNGPLVFILGRGNLQQNTPGIGSIMRGEYVSALFSSNSVTEFEKRYADAHSKITLAFSTAALTSIGAQDYQLRRQQLLACVPPAPLWTLTGLAMLLVVAAAGLTVLALWSLDDDVADIQSKLSIAGLIVTSFEDIDSHALTGPSHVHPPEEFDKLFTEYHGRKSDQPSRRIGFERNGKLFVTVLQTMMQKP